MNDLKDSLKGLNKDRVFTLHDINILIQEENYS